MSISQHWQLNPDIDFLNHGSFGATPTVIFDAQRNWIDQLERDPIRFLAPERELEPKLDHVRGRVAELVGATADCLAFVRNATDGVNAVLRSFRFQRDDEVVVTDHGYNACNNAVRFAAERWGARTRVARIPFPIGHADQVIEAIERELSARTRLLVVDHVTSPTGLVFPIERIIASARRHSVRVLVDGAHAPGMVPVDLKQLGADYYTANHHKWLCAPKASGFLYVDPRWQAEVRPTVISHGANRQPEGRSRFLTEFDWVGTFDPTPLLCVPQAIEFLSSLHGGGLQELMQRNREKALAAQQILSDALQIKPPAPASMIGSLVAVPLPESITRRFSDFAAIQRRLYENHRVEVPIFVGPDGSTGLLRVSLQAYNNIDQIERLADVLRSF